MSKLPDTRDTDKMALIGRQTVLRKARRECVQEMRDIVVPILNDYATRPDWGMTRLIELIDDVRALNAALDDLA